jgi:putative sigma-54 modulation protein
MKIRVTARHTELAQDLREHVEGKLENLARYFDRVDEAHVVFGREGPLSCADVTVHAARVVASSEQTGEDQRTAFDRALEKVERQIRRHKGRVRDRKHGERTAEAAALAGGMPPEELGIVPETLSGTPLTPEEALQQLDELNARFVVFENSETGKVNVIYRRDDGNYGLVERGD